MKLPKLIGVVHLPALPGAPHATEGYPAEILQDAGLRAVQEAQILAQSGYDAVILENFGDTPFYKNQVPPETVASMAIIAAAVRESVEIQIGINVLRNDARAALAIASITGCDFIRVNVLSGVAATDQGWIEGEAAFLARERERLRSQVAILADVHVKHAVTFSSLDLGVALEEVGARSLADGVIVTGQTTGRLIDRGALEVASKTARHLNIPLYLGSGVTRSSIPSLKNWVDGVIVGSDLRKDGIAGAELDIKRTREFARLFQAKTKSPTKKLKKKRK